MNAHALSVLEFHQALEKVAARAASPMGRERVLGLRPIGDIHGIRAELSRVGEALDLLGTHPDWSPPVPPDVSAALRVLSVDGGVLTPPALLEVLRLLCTSRILSEGLRQRTDPDSRPQLSSLCQRLPVRLELERRLAKIVDEDGTVRDDASPALRSVRRRISRTRGQVVRKLEALLGTLPNRIRVPDASVSVRDGRYVIPVRREGKSEVGGIIHGESASGATLFVEPPVALQLMNELQEAKREEAREIQRILREATEELRPSSRELEAGFEAQVDFDGLWARALAARAWSGTPPELLDPDEESLVIRGGRHPLLLEQDVEVVPFFLEVGPAERVIVVSGPNTGGKTVFLKALGLIHLLAQSGVVPPVEPGTRLPVVDDVFADIGDEQSITHSLSTFSAHLARAREILQDAGARSLILMDEIGTGTDPAEGAALARAMLEALVRRHARAFVTSHLGALKRLDEDGSGIVNASLHFDADRIAPTYRFLMGRPGRSYGLAIARRQGLPDEVLDRAEAYLDSGELRLEGLLEALDSREQELSAALAEAKSARTEAEQRRDEMRERAAQLDARERTAEHQARERARRLLLEAREEVEEAIREVRASRDAATTLGAVDEAGARARRRVETAVRNREPVSGSAGREGRSGTLPRVDEGDMVRVLGTGARGVVRDLSEQRVTVDVGGIRMELPREEVEPASKGEFKADRRSHTGSTGGATGWIGADVQARPETDLRGLRVDEVGLALGRALDDAVMGNLPELRIIHGIGTGAVKARVLELLRSDGRVQEIRPGGVGEGGSGVTVAVLA